MERGARYHQVCRSIVEQAAAEPLGDTGGIICFAVTDSEHGHYLAMTNGGNGHVWSYGPFLHLHVESERIIIEHDGPANGVWDHLVAAGVSERHISARWAMEAA